MYRLHNTMYCRYLTIIIIIIIVVVIIIFIIIIIYFFCLFVFPHVDYSSIKLELKKCLQLRWDIHVHVITGSCFCGIPFPMGIQKTTQANWSKIREFAWWSDCTVLRRKALKTNIRRSVGIFQTRSKLSWLSLIRLPPEK